MYRMTEPLDKASFCKAPLAEASLPIFADRAMSKPLYYLEDLHLGQRFKSGTHTLDAAQIKAFAAQYDPQPFHMDEKAAKKTSVFKGLAASGWHTASITMRLMVDGGLPLAGGIRRQRRRDKLASAN